MYAKYEESTKISNTSRERSIKRIRSFIATVIKNTRLRTRRCFLEIIENFLLKTLSYPYRETYKNSETYRTTKTNELLFVGIFEKMARKVYSTPCTLSSFIYLKLPARNRPVTTRRNNRNASNNLLKIIFQSVEKEKEKLSGIRREFSRIIVGVLSIPTTQDRRLLLRFKIVSPYPSKWHAPSLLQCRDRVFLTQFSGHRCHYRVHPRFIVRCART